jgi:uncharacterized protein (DUF362 family)
VTVVSVVQNPDVQQAVHEALELLGGIESFVHPGDKVMIKPNLVFALPSDTGFTTDPEVVKVLIELCKSLNPEDVTVAEASSGADENVFEACGYSELAREFGVKIVDLNECPYTMVEVPNGNHLKELRIPNIILESDVLINVPKLKLYTHIPGQSDWASLAVKNLMGAVPGRGVYSHSKPPEFTIMVSPELWKPEGKLFHPHHQPWWSPRGEKKRIHTNLTEGIVDLNTVIQPTLNVIDAMIVSQDVDMRNTKGESILKLNTILAGSNPLALDFIATKIAGLDPFNISYLKRAAERGIGESDYERIQTIGTPIEDIARIWEKGLENQ